MFSNTRSGHNSAEASIRLKVLRMGDSWMNHQTYPKLNPRVVVPPNRVLKKSLLFHSVIG